MVATFTSQRENDVWDPADNGFVAGTCRIPDIATSSTPTVGRCDFMRFNIRRAVTINNIWFNVTTVGATPTAGQNWLGIYDSNGNLLVKVNTDANVTIGNANQVVLPAPLRLAKGYYYLAMVWNAATTPTIHRITLATNATANMNLTAKAYGSFAGVTDLGATVDISTLGTSFNIWGFWFS